MTPSFSNQDLPWPAELKADQGVGSQNAKSGKELSAPTAQPRRVLYATGDAWTKWGVDPVEETADVDVSPDATIAYFCFFFNPIARI
jgi:hypothetical protein